MFEFCLFIPHVSTLSATKIAPGDSDENAIWIFIFLTAFASMTAAAAEVTVSFSSTEEDNVDEISPKVSFCSPTPFTWVVWYET